MKRFFVFLLLFLAIAIISNGQASFILEGTIGKYPVVMKLSKELPGYFYTSTRREIELEFSSEKNNTVILRKTGYDNGASKEIVHETFILKRTGNEWKGTWQTKNKQLPVLLKPVDTVKYDFNSIPHINYYFDDAIDRIYHKTRLSHLTFVKDSLTRSGIYQLQWMHEKLTGITGFRVVNGYAQPILDRVNTVLTKKQLEDVLGYLTCNGLKDDFDYQQADWQPFLSPEFISVQAYTSSFCGGAHPNYSNTSFTIDIRKGKEVEDIDELFWFTGSKPIAKDSGIRDHYLEERSRAIVLLITRLYPAEMKKPSSEDSCDYSDPERWKYPYWFLTDKGLYITPSFTHAEHSCENPEFTWIPYSVLAEHKSRERK